jgi:hypothetical protein
MFLMALSRRIVLLLDGVIDFRFTPLIALKNSFSKFALPISHSFPFAGKRRPTCLGDKQ